MNYVEDTGMVVSVDGEKATVRLDRKPREECGSCCACSAFSTGGGPPAVDVPRDDLEEGERVRVRIPRVNAYLSMALVFGLPLALFMAGIAVGQRLEGGARVGNVSALGGLIGLITAFLVAWLANRLLVRRAGPPQVFRMEAVAQSAPPQGEGSP